MPKSGGQAESPEHLLTSYPETDLTLSKVRRFFRFSMKRDNRYPF